MKSVIISIVILFSFSIVEGAVWNVEPGKEWTDEWRNQYSQWIENKVDGDFFKKLGSPYSQLKMDCADAHYALIAYFSRLNGLPFTVDQSKLSHLTNRFDHIKDSELRMASFIEFLRANYGTESLAHNDTFPPAIHQLMPGDIFMWKIGSNKNYTRHTYIIKSINPNGTFNVLYSTQDNAALTGSLYLKNEYMFNKVPNHSGNDQYKWGFRRMKFPQHSGVPQQDIPSASFEQYDWAKSYNTLNFFIRVQETNQTHIEKPARVIDRLFKSLCSSVQERIESVNKAINYLNQTKGACMTFQPYDAYSTPGRDSGIMNEFNVLYEYLSRYHKSGELNSIPNKIKEPVLTIYNSNPSENQREKLFNACPIEFGPNPQDLLDLETFKTLLFDGQVSFHPNDNLYRRWGFEEGKKTTCKQHYGYPE